MQKIFVEAAMKILVPIILRLLGENYGLWGDKFFDLIENAIKDSKTTIDDKFLPVIEKLRDLMNIPDLPDVD